LSFLLSFEREYNIKLNFLDVIPVIPWAGIQSYFPSISKEGRLRNLQTLGGRHDFSFRSKQKKEKMINYGFWIPAQLTTGMTQ